MFTEEELRMIGAYESDNSNKLLILCFSQHGPMDMKEQTR